MPRGVKKVVPEPKKAEVSEMTEVSELVRLTEVALAKKPRAKKMKEEAPKVVEVGTVTISKEEYALLKSYEASHLAKVAQRKARREQVPVEDRPRHGRLTGRRRPPHAPLSRRRSHGHRRGPG